MIPMRLREVAATVDGNLAAGADVVVDAVSTDSRDVTSGALFVALRGGQRDGHAYVRDALTAGAAAALVEGHTANGEPCVEVDDTWQALRRLAAAVRASVDPVVVAVTGSVGKTTTKDLTAAALSAGHTTVAARGSFNNELGVPLTLLALEPSTTAMVSELGARRPGDIADLAALVAPDVAVVTAVAAVHLEVFGDIEAVARTKAELLASLTADGTAVLNADDERVAAMAASAPGHVLRYALDDPTADLTARDLALDHHARARFTALTPWGRAEVRLPVAGRHHVGNALAALAAAGACGVDLEPAAAALATATVSAWRGEVREVGGVVVVNDAYNANPTSVRAALGMLGSIRPGRGGRTFAVLGVMAEIGAGHDAEHTAIGRAVHHHAVDELVVVGDAAAPIRLGATTAGLPEGRVHTAADATAALDLLAGRVRPGDVVLVKASRVAALETVAAGLGERLAGTGIEHGTGGRR